MAEENKETKKPVEETPKQETSQEVKKKEGNEPRGISRGKTFNRDEWTPLTKLGRMVKGEKISNIDEILDNGMTILESAIVDALIPDIQSDLLAVGQSKGKFGGGKRSIWRQTQKKTNEGNKPSFSALAVIGNYDGYVGLAIGKARETVPAREKATRKAKLNIIKIMRGCGSWESSKPQPNSIPFAVEGKCGSVKVKLMPAPPGTGLVAEKECRKILKMAGISDIYSKTSGHTGTKLNMLTACFNALKKLSDMRVQQEHYQKLGIVEGSKA
tara:strand:+ start:1594 stop:2406 length:813 start_codon:yes stop_codon:yes gene_type:complete